MANLNIGYWNDEKKFNIGSIVDANFDGTVEDFKLKVIQKLQLYGKEIEIMYAGLFLDGKSTLKECRLKPDNVVHIIVKTPPVELESVYDNLDTDIQKYIAAFAMLSTTQGYKRYVEKINTQEIFDELVTTVPGLVSDPVGITLLKHPELLVTCTTDESVRGIVGEHPSLVLGITRLMNVIHTELLAEFGYTSLPTTLQMHEMYFNPDDDEEDTEPMNVEPEQQEVEQEANQPQSATPAPFVTLSEFSAMVANSMARIENQSGPPTASSNDAMTPEVICNTIGQSLANVVARPDGGGAQGEIVTLRKLRQMRLYGCTIDSVNVQALQLANGDVEAAVNLVLSGNIPGYQAPEEMQQ